MNKLSVKNWVALAGAALSASAFGAIEIPTEGLLFDLDSSARATLQCDASGFVTNWLCARGSGIAFRSVDTQGPFLDATAFGGRGALVFGQDRDATSVFRTGLRADNEFRNQTVFMVFQWRGTIGGNPKMGEIYGATGVDHGIRGDYYNRMYTWGDSAIANAITWFDGVKQTKRTTAANDIIPSLTTDVGKVPYVYCAVNTNDTNAAVKGWGGGTWQPTLGGYSQHSTGTGMRFFLGSIAEVIVYNRALTEAEVDEINDKLMHKWYGTDPKPENLWITVEGSVDSYGAPTPAYGKYVKGEAGETFSMAECLSTDTDGKRIVTAEKTAGQRSVYLGYEVVNAAGEVLQSSDTDETFTYTATEPITVRWRVDRECCAALTAGENGQVAVAGGTAGASAEVWQYAGTKVRVQAIPAEGYHLAYWKGTVDGVDILDPDQKILLTGATQLEAVFAAGEPDYPKMLTRGLVFKLDATDADSVRVNADGYVTNWYSRVGDMPFDINVTSVKPFVQADAMGGRGSVRFGLQKDGATLANTPLKASVASPKVVRTFLTVLSQVKDAGDMTYPIGYAGDNFIDTAHNYGYSCYLGGRLYNQQWTVDGRIWMDDGALRQYPDKLKGKANTAYVAQFGDTKNVTHVLICEDNDASSAAHTDGKHPLALGNANGDPTHASGVKRCFPGDFGEAAGYDRTLTPAEVRYMMAFMNKKWKGEAFDMTKWTADTIVGEDATYENLYIEGVRTITVAAGRKLTVKNLLVISDNVTFIVNEGATLTIPEIVKYYPEANVSFQLAGGTLALVEEGNAYEYNNEANTDPLSRFGSPLNLTDDLTAYTPLAWPGNMTGTGTIRLAGARPLVLAADDVIPDNLAWELMSGTLDLNGRDLVAADVKGPARLVNTADAAATLTVGRDSAFALEPRLAGKISVVRQGTGDMTLGGVSKAEGALELSEGQTALSCATFAPGSISNLVCHLDASRTETLHFGDDGRVVQWDSLAGDGATFIEREGTSSRKSTTYFTYRGPDYDATALNGKPGLLFSVDEDFKITSATNSLFGDRSFVAKTIIAIVKPVNTPGGQGYHWGHVWAESNYGGTGYGAECLKFENWLDGSENGWHWGQKDSKNFDRVFVNGKFYFDRATGLDESRLAADSFGTPQLFAQSFTGNCTYTPAVGSLCDHIRNFRGVISEIVVYSHCLTKEELQRVSTALMAKWGVTPAEEAEAVSGDHLAADSTLNLGAGATLDLGGMTHHVANFVGGGTLANGTLVEGSARLTANLSADGFYTTALTLDAANGSVYPTLSLLGAWNLTQTDLALANGPAKPHYQVLVTSASRGLVGPFKSAPEGVVLTPKKATLGRMGFSLIVR